MTMIISFKGTTCGYLKKSKHVLKFRDGEWQSTFTRPKTKFVLSLLWNFKYFYWFDSTFYQSWHKDGLCLFRRLLNCY